MFLFIVHFKKGVQIGGVMVFNATFNNISVISWLSCFMRSKVKVQQVIMVCDTPPYGHAPTYQISLTYLERQKCYGPDNKILFKIRGSGEPVGI
jgi:hypothetical protein